MKEKSILKMRDSHNLNILANKSTSAELSFVIENNDSNYLINQN